MDRLNHTSIGRRGLLARAGAVTAGGLTAALAGGRAGAPAAAVVSPATVAPAGGPPGPGGFGPVTVRPGDPRYDSLLRGDNWLFAGRPEEIRVAGSASQVERAVADAVRSGRRVAVRSGGHCFENFTADPAVRMLLDLSPMDQVGYDPGRRAFAVQPGATLGQVYKTLFTGWGVTIPAGGCPEVGAGGHITGGGYGPLSRRYGMVVDHLYAVEVVVVGRDGRVRTVLATREQDDPNRDLWWACAGGGGGNFGVITRYWLRSPGATGSDPARLLPPAPRQQIAAALAWAWDEHMTRTAFTTLLRNFGRWHERNSAPGSRYEGLYAILIPLHQASGSIQMTVQIDTDVPGADGLVTEFISAVTAGTRLTKLLDTRVRLPWLHPTTWPGTGEAGNVITRRYKNKAGDLRRSFTEGQIATIYRYLTDGSTNPTRGILFFGYGGQVNAVPPGATADPHRDAVMKTVFQTIWADQSDDAANLAWIRDFYRDVYTGTGGVPVPDQVNAGAYINYPDNDLADPAWNTSGVRWHTLYYGANYPRLQQAKARWDPRNVFHHALAVELPR
jgi:aclacinomycin oxidase